MSNRIFPSRLRSMRDADKSFFKYSVYTRPMHAPDSYIGMRSCPKNAWADRLKVPLIVFLEKNVTYDLI